MKETTLIDTPGSIRRSMYLLVEEVLLGIQTQDINRAIKSFHDEIEFRGFDPSIPVTGKDILEEQFSLKLKTIAQFRFKLKDVSFDEEKSIGVAVIEYEYDIGKERKRVFEIGCLTISNGLIIHYISAKNLLEKWDL